MTAINTEALHDRFNEARLEHWTEQVMVIAEAAKKMSKAEISRRLDLSRGHVSKLVSVSRLPPEFLEHARTRDGRSRPKYAREIFLCLALQSSYAYHGQVLEAMRRGEDLTTEWVREILGWSYRVGDYTVIKDRTGDPPQTKFLPVSLTEILLG